MNELHEDSRTDPPPTLFDIFKNTENKIMSPAKSTLKAYEVRNLERNINRSMSRSFDSNSNSRPGSSRLLFDKSQKNPENFLEFLDSSLKFDEKSSEKVKELLAIHRKNSGEPEAIKPMTSSRQILPLANYSVVLEKLTPEMVISCASGEEDKTIQTNPWISPKIENPGPFSFDLSVYKRKREMLNEEFEIKPFNNKEEDHEEEEECDCEAEMVPKSASKGRAIENKNVGKKGNKKTFASHFEDEEEDEEMMMEELNDNDEDNKHNNDDEETKGKEEEEESEEPVAIVETVSKNSRKKLNKRRAKIHHNRNANSNNAVPTESLETKTVVASTDDKQDVGNVAKTEEQKAATKPIEPARQPNLSSSDRNAQTEAQADATAQAKKAVAVLMNSLNNANPNEGRPNAQKPLEKTGNIKVEEEKKKRRKKKKKRVAGCSKLQQDEESDSDSEPITLGRQLNPNLTFNHIPQHLSCRSINLVIPDSQKEVEGTQNAISTFLKFLKDCNGDLDSMIGYSPISIDEALLYKLTSSLSSMGLLDFDGEYYKAEFPTSFLGSLNIPVTTVKTVRAAKIIKKETKQANEQRIDATNYKM
eukprot:TRINITY_DN2979_c0_g2_i8.p1 TRINITY_DN2979_c0_g2~~TRINITY_DN2979_c0_g2_i8.p1  ORF type:complete len:589 (+),score=182.13 TRINITY_DN2979_c0_g2_i8:921-2687(+)